MNQERKKGTGILEKNRFFRSLARHHVLMACTVYFILSLFSQFQTVFPFLLRGQVNFW